MRLEPATTGKRADEHMERCIAIMAKRNIALAIVSRYGTQPGSSDACRTQLATSSSSSWSSSWIWK